jgi:hypothetical protein
MRPDPSSVSRPIWLTEPLPRGCGPGGHGQRWWEPRQPSRPALRSPWSIWSWSSDRSQGRRLRTELLNEVGDTLWLSPAPSSLPRLARLGQGQEQANGTALDNRDMTESLLPPLQPRPRNRNRNKAPLSCAANGPSAADRADRVWLSASARSASAKAP